MSKRILIVDDEPGTRRSFSRVLEAAGYVTIEAASGPAGLDALDEGSFDLILLDLKMPGLGGVETLREIRKRLPQLPVYILTAFQKEFAVELQAAARDGLHFELMRKPIKAEQLVEVTRAILAQR